MISLHVPLTAILFFLAVTVAPKDAREIQITGPHFSAHWKRTETGWQGGEYHLKNLWSIKDGTVVQTEGGPFAGKHDVVGEVRPALNHNWNREPKIELDRLASMEKTEAGFLYTSHHSDREFKYEISYDNDGSPYTDIPLLDWLHTIKESHAERLPKWTPRDAAPIPLSLGQALALVKTECEKMPNKPKIKHIVFFNGRSDASHDVWFYNFLCQQEHTLNSCDVVVLLDGTVLTPQTPLPPEHRVP